MSFSGFRWFILARNIQPIFCVRVDLNLENLVKVFFFLTMVTISGTATFGIGVV